MFAENVHTYFQVFGVPCAKGRQSFVGVLDTPEDDFALGSEGVRLIDAVVQHALGAVILNVGDTIHVDGVAYRVRSTRFIDDGQIIEAGITRITS